MPRAVKRPLARSWAAAALALLLLPAATGAEEPPLRVGTSGDYAPFSLADEGGDLSGFDVAVARAYAADRGREIEFVRFGWPDLLSALARDRFDVAMSGVTVRPERSTAGVFTVPVVESGAVVLVRGDRGLSRLSQLDRRGVRIAVNAGGHLERVAGERFRRATLVAIPDNAAVLAALAEGAVDAAVTDTLEAPRWQGEIDGAARLGPFTRDRKAYLARAERADLAADLDRWLLARERDGTLAALRREHLEAASGGPVATPLGALLAAVDERLALMPIVARAKRREGLPLEVPEREEVVLAAAVAAVRGAADRAGERPPPDAVVRALFRAQMEAAKEVQWAATRATADDAAEPPSVASVLRPALLRIGDRIARLVVELPGDLERADVREAARAHVRSPHVSAEAVERIADAVVLVSRAKLRATVDAPSPGR